MIPPGHPCSEHLCTGTPPPPAPQNRNNPRDAASPHPTALNPGSGMRLGNLGFFAGIQGNPGESQIPREHPHLARQPHAMPTHGSPLPPIPPLPWGAALHPDIRAGASPILSHCRDATPPSPRCPHFLPSLPPLRITGGGPGVAGGRGAGPHVKNSLMRKGGGALWSPVRGCQRAGGLATFPQQRRWETPAGGQPSHAPGRPLPSANPGTMRARAIQAFQLNPAIEIQGFNPNAVPWAGGRGREGEEGRCPFPIPSHQAPALPPGSPDHGMLRSRVDLGGQTDPAQLRMATESSARQWGRAGAVAGNPCPGKARLVQPDTHVLLLQGLPEGHKTALGGPRAPYNTHTPPRQLPPGVLASGQHPQRGVLTHEVPTALTSPRAGWVHPFKRAKAERLQAPKKGENQLVSPKSAKPASFHQKVQNQPKTRAEHVPPESCIAQANPYRCGVLSHWWPLKPRWGG